MSDREPPHVTQQSSGSGKTGLAIIVGGLVVAVAFLAYVVFGGAGGDADDVNVTIEGGGDAVEDAGAAVEGAADAVEDAVEPAGTDTEGN